MMSEVITHHEKLVLVLLVLETQCAVVVQQHMEACAWCVSFTLQKQ